MGNIKMKPMRKTVFDRVHDFIVKQRHIANGVIE